MNFLRMTIKNGNVYKLKSHFSDDAIAAFKKVTFYLPSYAKPIFSGSYEDCFNFIEKSGAVYERL